MVRKGEWIALCPLAQEPYLRPGVKLYLLLLWGWCFWMDSGPVLWVACLQSCLWSSILSSPEAYCGSPVSCCSWMLDLAHNFAFSLLLMHPVTSLALLAVVVLSSRLIFLHGSAWFLLLTVLVELGKYFGDMLPHTYLLLGFIYGCVHLCAVSQDAGWDECLV